MITQKFMGRNQLINRLSAQVGNRELAIRILQRRGHLVGEKLTAEGKRRNDMTAEERSNDRASKNGKEMFYNPLTNKSNGQKSTISND